MKVIILGGDGFCGWPTALRFLSSGHDVTIVDNLSRRAIDDELSSNSLTNISSITDRINTAKNCFGENIKFVNLDVAKQYDKFVSLLNEARPDTIVHFAEQRAAPYSMIGNKERRYTVDNNITCTHNVCSAIIESKQDIHLVHLGTMGVYGYSKQFGSIPEGYLNIKVNETQEDVDILYPTNPGSIYHMTKSLDQIIFQFYNKNWGLRVTDLHQGIVWGTQTKETSADDKLVNRFDYDGIYGTVLNRFISQAACNVDLTVYGTGGQSRAFIHINDTCNCVLLAAKTPADNSKVRIFNQVSEVKSVKQLAEIIKESYGANISYVDNPRNEAAENDLVVHNEGLQSLGFKPILLSDELIEDVRFIATQYENNLNRNNVLSSPKWS